MKVFFLGPEGSFSQRAALKLLERLDGQGELVARPTVEAVAQSLSPSPSSKPMAQGDLAIVPYYNFLEGLVQEHLDLLFEHHLRIVGMIRVSIEFSVGVFPGAQDRSVVYSHHKALAQVSEHLRAQYADARLEPVSSTAEAARLVADKQAGIAIASEAALLKFGLEIIGSNVGNLRHGKHNFTDFFVVARNGAVELDRGGNRHTLLAITPPNDRRGLLAEALGQFAFYGLDVAKIHSRPALEPVDIAAEPQMFYLEVKCERNAPALQRCGEAIEYRLGQGGAGPQPMFRVLGDFQVPA